jgi:hypothetical protein
MIFRDEEVPSRVATHSDHHKNRMPSLHRTTFLVSAVIALVTWLALLVTLGPGPRGPGLTCDEYYYAALGKSLVQSARDQGWRFFSAANIDRNFSAARMHPPLGRWLLGLTHAIFDPRPNATEAVWIPGARLAPATVFSWAVFLVGMVIGRQYGAWPALAASVVLALSPRAFAHAHFAALDTLAAVSALTAILGVYWAARAEEIRWWRFALAGVLWGLALLTKINGFLLFAPIVLWLVVRLRLRAVIPVCVWFVAGGATFFLGWPWLWNAPWPRLVEFLATATARQSLSNFYEGQAWRDIDTPWHYPWVMTGVTLPLGILALGLVGLFWPPTDTTGRRLPLLVIFNLVAALLPFSLPGVAVYDGARLFLIVYPLWAMLAGLGVARLRQLCDHTSWMCLRRSQVDIAIATLLLAQCVGVVIYHPFQTSYYNLLVGGLRGAERLGFEVNYWGDAVDHRLLARTAQVADVRPVFFAPNLALWQAPSVGASSPELVERRVELSAWNPLEQKPESLADRLILVYHRRADQQQWQPLVQGATILAENARRGVWVARLYRLRNDP